MRFFPRLIFGATACIAAAGGVIYWLARANQVDRSHAAAHVLQSTPRMALSAPYPGPGLTTLPDPAAPPGSSSQVFIDRQSFDGLVAAVTAQFTDQVRDQSSLEEYRQAIAHRAERAKAQLRERLSLFHLDTTPTLEQASQAISIY
jgi:hypothetical protein